MASEFLEESLEGKYSISIARKIHEESKQEVASIEPIEEERELQENEQLENQSIESFYTLNDNLLESINDFIENILHVVCVISASFAAIWIIFNLIKILLFGSDFIESSNIEIDSFWCILSILIAVISYSLRKSKLIKILLIKVFEEERMI